MAGDLKALIACTEDGRLIGILQGDNLPPINSPGIGSWTHQGGRAFAVTFRVVVYDPEGALIGVAKVRGTCLFDETGNAWSGQFKYEVIAPNGNILLTTKGPWQATRIKVEPLN